MNRLIDSVEKFPNEDFNSVFEYIVEHELSLKEERDFADYLMACRSKFGFFPSRTLIESKFNIKTGKKDPYTPEDLLIHFKEKNSERHKIRASSILQEASSLLLKGEKVDSLMEEATSHLGKKDNLLPLREVSLRTLSVIEFVESRKAKGGANFHVEDLDLLVEGIESGTAVTIGGFVGNFKTSCAISMAVGNARSGLSSSFLTLEMPAKVLKVQAMSNFSASPSWEGQPIPFKSILKNSLSIEEREMLPALEDAFHGMKGEINIFSGGDVKGDMLKSVPQIAEYYADKGHKFFFIDHVQLLKYYVKSESAFTAVDCFVKTMTDTAIGLDERGYDFRVVFLSQINREGYKKALRRGGMYDLSALAEYSELERSSAYIVTAFTTDELKAINELKMQLLKQRIGSTSEEPLSVFVDPQYCLVGGSTVMSNFEADEESISNLLGDDFGF